MFIEWMDRWNAEGPTVTNESTTLGAEPTMSRSSKAQISSEDSMTGLEFVSSSTENTDYISLIFEHSIVPSTMPWI